MKTEFLVMGKTANGYFGDYMPGAFVFDPASTRTLFVWSGGFFEAGVPLCVDATEALWTLKKRVDCGRLPYMLG